MPRTMHRRIAFHFHDMEGLWKVFSLFGKVFGVQRKVLEAQRKVFSMHEQVYPKIGKRIRKTEQLQVGTCTRV